MGDSFFGFNTSLPLRGDREMARGGYDEALFEAGGDINSKIKDYAARAGEDLEIYDFGGLRQELEEDDSLADQLIEDNDDLNDVTFSVDVRKDGPDFDFVTNTENFNTRISENEAFFVKPKQNQNRQSQSQSQSGFVNPWVPSRNNFEDNQRHFTSLSRGHSASSRGMDDSSPAMAPSSIWGDFGSPHEQSYASALHSQGNKQPYLGQQQQPYGLAGGPGHQRGQTFEEIEAELQRTAGYHAQMPTGDHQPGMLGNHGPGKKMLTMAEVEAAMLAKGGTQNAPFPQQQQPQQPQFGYGNVDPAQLMAIRQQQELLEHMSTEKELKRREQMRQQAEKSRYDKLMTGRDKEFINRIQLQQLASGDPFADDFYYQVYSAIRQRAGLPPPGVNKDPLLENKTREGDRNKRSNRREENAMHKMQQQVQRIVNDAKRRPKQTQLSLEGALGKITTHSVRNPRQLLQVSDRKTSGHSAQDSPEHSGAEAGSKTSTPPRKVINDRKKVLKVIEDLYTTVLKLEQLRREAPSPVARPGYEKEHQESIERWNTDYADAINTLWSQLRIEEDPEGAQGQHPFISILSVHKGKKLIPRIARHCSPERIYAILKLIVSHFDTLKVCHMATTNTPSQEQDRSDFVSLEDVELFMNTVIPPMLAYVAEAPFSTICDLLQLMLQRNDIIYVAKSKAGLSLLTMFLSRAEILKQGGGALQGLASCTEEEIIRWDMLYQQLYDKLHDQFLTFFPPPVILPGNNQAINAVHLANNADDTYVWQFLAAIAVGASMEQQHSLVTEVRDRVMEDIVMSSSNRLPAEQAAHKISNVNLFLHALGLDASQVTVPV